MSYKIKVTVTGGYTGTRTSFIKRNDQIILFADKDQAEDYAQELRDVANQGYKTNGLAFKAMYFYEVVENF